MVSMLCLGWSEMSATNFDILEPLTLQSTEINTDLYLLPPLTSYSPTLPEQRTTLRDMPVPTTDKWTWMNTNPGVQPYKVMDDLTFVGIPVFVAGIIAKSEKKNFAQLYQNSHANTRLLTSFKTGIDDYSQYFGPAMTLGLKIGGVEGHVWQPAQPCPMVSWLPLSMVSSTRQKRCAPTEARPTHGPLVTRQPRL